MHVGKIWCNEDEEEEEEEDKEKEEDGEGEEPDRKVSRVGHYVEFVEGKERRRMWNDDEHAGFMNVFLKEVIERKQFPLMSQGISA